MAKVCKHKNLIKDFPDVDKTQCKKCVEMGDDWVHLRQCLICGNVGCCDSSKNKHATAHFKKTGHPIINSASPDQVFTYCYIDDLFFNTK